MLSYRQRLAEALRRESISQKDFAAIAGLSRSYLNQVLKGHAMPGEAAKAKIDSALGYRLEGWQPPQASYEQVMEKHLQEESRLAPRLLKEISDVQHGRKDCVDGRPDNSPPLSRAGLLELFLQAADSLPDDIFAAFGRSVWQIVRGKEADGD